MVKIRLARMGKKKRPFYRVVVTNSRSPRETKFLDTLGYYDPLREPEVFEVAEEKLIFWQQRGAQVSETVKNLLIRKGIWQKQ